MTTGHRSHWSGLSLKPCVLPIGSIQAYIQQSESGNYTLLANAQWERWGESGSIAQLSFCFICFVVVVVGMWNAVKSNQRGVQCDMCDSCLLVQITAASFFSIVMQPCHMSLTWTGYRRVQHGAQLMLNGIQGPSQWRLATVATEAAYRSNRVYYRLAAFKLISSNPKVETILCLLMLSGNVEVNPGP